MRNIHTISSPIGFITLTSEHEYLISVDFKARQMQDGTTLCDFMKHCVEVFDAYFAKKIEKIDIPYKFYCGTKFQQDVWEALKTIPYGKTISYKELASLVGKPKAYRAVGGANNKNPLPLIIPCHRVIGSNNSLVGYAGGLDIKKFLLNLENRDFNNK